MSWSTQGAGAKGPVVTPGPGALVGPSGPPAEIYATDDMAAGGDVYVTSQSPWVASFASGAPGGFIAYTTDRAFNANEFLRPGGGYSNVPTLQEDEASWAAPQPVVIYDAIAMVTTPAIVAAADVGFSVRRDGVAVGSLTLLTGTRYVTSNLSFRLTTTQAITVQLTTAANPGSAILMLFKWQPL